MKLSQENRNDIVKYRLQRAKETIEDVVVSTQNPYTFAVTKAV